MFIGKGNFMSRVADHGHKNLCQGLRGMTSEESDQLIINNWNKVVTKTRYCLCTWGYHYGKPK